MLFSKEPIIFIKKGDNIGRLRLISECKGPAYLAAKRLVKVGSNELNCHIEICTTGDKDSLGRVIAICSPWAEAARILLHDNGIILSPNNEIKILSEDLYGEQSFIATRLGMEKNSYLLAANTQIGLKNAILTLCDRLYYNDNGDIMIDSFDGIHRPAFSCRHIKTDAMNCGRFRANFNYWDPTTQTGVDDFVDWIASFRITDYNLLTFMRGWGLTYGSERFYSLVDTQHPNSTINFYPKLIDRFHKWGVKVWASDIYIASGYSMEAGTCPEMLSPCANSSRLRPFKAGHGTFDEILSDPEAIACLSSPAAAKFYSDIVADILEHHPMLDGLDFHIGHTFPHKICRCSKCNGINGNRELAYRCFVKVYETAVKKHPSLRLKTAVKMFGDATRSIVEHYKEFPHLELFCWLRWLGNFLVEQADAPVTIGHEDGGGGLEANHSLQKKHGMIRTPQENLDMIRNYFRDYESWIWTYIQIARKSSLSSISWEAVLQQEIGHLFFLYSQLTWEPDLNWKEFARRYVIRSERRQDTELVEAYSLLLEINSDLTSWGLAPHELNMCQRVTQIKGLLETRIVNEKVAALQHIVSSWTLENNYAKTPIFFDLRWSLVKSLNRLQAKEVVDQWH